MILIEENQLGPNQSTSKVQRCLPVLGIVVEVEGWRLDRYVLFYIPEARRLSAGQPFGEKHLIKGAPARICSVTDTTAIHIGQDIFVPDLARKNPLADLRFMALGRPARKGFIA